MLVTRANWWWSNFWATFARSEDRWWRSRMGWLSHPLETKCKRHHAMKQALVGPARTHDSRRPASQNTANGGMCSTAPPSVRYDSCWGECKKTKCREGAPCLGDAVLHRYLVRLLRNLAMGSLTRRSTAAAQSSSCSKAHPREIAGSKASSKTEGS